MATPLLLPERSESVLGVSFDALGTLIGFRHNKTTSFRHINELLRDSGPLVCGAIFKPVHFADPDSDILKGGGELGASYFAILAEYAVAKQADPTVPLAHKRLLCQVVHYIIAGETAADTGFSCAPSDIISDQFKKCCAGVEVRFSAAYKKASNMVRCMPERAPKSFPLLAALKELNVTLPSEALLAKPIVGGCSSKECLSDWVAIAAEVFDPLFREVLETSRRRQNPKQQQQQLPHSPSDEVVSEETLVEVLDDFCKYLVDAFATSTAYRILPEARTTLEGMQALVYDPKRLVGVPVTVVTNNDARLKTVLRDMELVLASTMPSAPPSSRLFDTLVTTHDIGGIAKPSPIGILQAMLDTIPDVSLEQPPQSKVWIHVGDHRDDELAAESCTEILQMIYSTEDTDHSSHAPLVHNLENSTKNVISTTKERLKKIARVCHRVVHVDVVGTNDGAQWDKVKKWLW